MDIICSDPSPQLFSMSEMEEGTPYLVEDNGIIVIHITEDLYIVFDENSDMGIDIFKRSDVEELVGDIDCNCLIPVEIELINYVNIT